MATKLTNLRLCQTYKNIACNLRHQQRRFKHKKKWALNERKKSDTDKALENFDLFYKPVYGDVWPSIRISLLSKQKYCALVNNNVDYLKVKQDLQMTGTFDVMQRARERLESLDDKSDKDREKTFLSGHSVDTEEGPSRLQPDESQNAKRSSEGDENLDNDEEENTIPSFIHYEKNTSLFNFVPVKKVYSIKETKQKDEVMASTYHQNSNSNIPIRIEQDDTIEIPEKLRVYTHDRGEIRDFRSPKYTNNLLEYFLMDAASLLPVIALDLQTGDSVLDLCACPGGKTLAMLQTETADRFKCNDLSKSRMNRLTQIVKSYIPEDVMPHISISVQDGTQFTTPEYDKVLVDVPCNTDRHNLFSEENNLFKSGRVNERIKLPILQRDLLVAGIKSCLNGGNVVYSTCTLSPAQNDGVVQSALEHIWANTSIDVAVTDISYLAQAFSDTFNFYPNCRYGQLVIPSLSSNFGPMYICKLKKISEGEE